MARKPRIEYEGCVYHVLIRGNHKQIVFHDKQDFNKYISLLISYKKRMNFKLYAYVLMQNHNHLLLEAGKVPLSKIMQGINQSYTMYYNRKYSKVGHLFQGRYKSIVCDADSYLAVLVRYIHLNPVRTMVVKKPEDYKWSGHNDYLSENINSLLDTDTVLRMFSEDKSVSRQLYGKFIESSISRKSNLNNYIGKDQRVLGNEVFFETIMKKIDENSIEKRLKKVSLEKLFSQVVSITKVSSKEILGKGRSEAVSKARHIFIIAGVESGHQGKEIAQYIGRDPASVSRRLKEADLVRKEVKEILNNCN